MPDITQQSLVSDEIQEIVSYRPGWIIRKGNLLFFLILLLLLSLTFVISYPDMVKASARIVALNAPKTLTAKKEGRLEKLLVKNGEYVKSGQILAYLQSTGRHKDVLVLGNWLSGIEEEIQSGNIAILRYRVLPRLDDLGEMQPEYEDFKNTLKETMQLLPAGYYQQKKKDLIKDIQHQSSIRFHLDRQKALEEKEYALQEIEYKANEELASEKVIAPLELNKDKGRLLSKEKELEQASMQLINNDMAKLNKHKELLELQKLVTDQEQKFRADFFKLKSKIEEWKELHIVQSPSDGRLEYISFLQENQLLSGGQGLFFIQPPQSIYYAEMKAGQSNFGKLKTGQNVQLHLEGYPSSEFGYLPGTISYISNMPDGRDSFLIKVDLSEGLVTTYNRKILFRNNLSASVSVIADNRKLSDRIFGQLRVITAK